MEIITCPKCNSTNYKTEQKGIHLTATCIDCGSYIKHIPVDKPKLYFGKYKGQDIESITDLQYLRWLVKETKQTHRIKSIINARISELEYMFR